MTAQRKGHEANINQWRKTYSPSPQMDCSWAQFPEWPAQGHPHGRADAPRVTGYLLVVPREAGCSWPILPSPPFSISLCSRMGFCGGSDSKESVCDVRDPGWIPGSGRSPWERLPTPAFLPGKCQGQRTLAGYSPWGSQIIRHNCTANTITSLSALG